MTGNQTKASFNAFLYVGRQLNSNYEVAIGKYKIPIVK